MLVGGNAVAQEPVALVVVVNKQSPIDTLSKKQVIDLYMGRYLSFSSSDPVVKGLVTGR
ncbi:hypothetical protein GCM10027098_41480 [Bowmanella dokdonensis]